MAKITTNFMSEALGRPIEVNMVVPADHLYVPDAGALPTPNKPYQTLYFLEGSVGNSTGTLNYTALQGIAEDYNLAVVCIGGENKWYGGPGITGEDFKSMIVRDVVNYTRRVFNLSHRREDTFIGGFSMGGYGAYVIGLNNPDLFSHIISCDAALNKAVILGSSDEETWDLYKKRAYESMFGYKDIAEYEGSDNDYEYVAAQLAKNAPEKMPRIFAGAGSKDALIVPDKEFFDYLTRLGYDTTWYTAEGSGHSFYTQERVLKEAITKWLPLENFTANYSHYGEDADMNVSNYSTWRIWCNAEADLA